MGKAVIVRPETKIKFKMEYEDEFPLIKYFKEGNQVSTNCILAMINDKIKENSLFWDIDTKVVKNGKVIFEFGY